MDDRVFMADVARVLGVSRPRVWQLRKRDDFPEPAGRDGGRDYYYETAILRWAAQAGRDLQGRAPLLFQRPDDGRVSRFENALVSSGNTVLIWDTSLGRLGLIYPSYAVSGLPDQRLVRRVLDDTRQLDAAVVVRDGYDAYGPELIAVDTQTPDREYSPNWEDLAEIFGSPVPWWPTALRKPKEVIRWRPGAKQVTSAPLNDVDVDVFSNAALDEPADSPIARTLTAFTREMRRGSRRLCEHDVALVSECLAYQNGHLQIAAMPIQADDTEAEVPEVVRRAAWIEMLKRTDMTAHDCVREMIAWNGGADFPYAAITSINPHEDKSAAEWVRSLEPGDSEMAAYALFDDADQALAHLVDPRTDVPVVQFDDEDQPYKVAAPIRLPARSALIEIILGANNNIWIRTEDGELYPAPHRWGAGLSYGYSGGGPSNLAILIEHLLDDIAAAAPVGNEEFNRDLLALIARDWPEGTVLTRTQLTSALKGNLEQ
ncbi:helix-turn-helix domain-containing protein [Kribbella sp. NPDC003505]|uniref:helix-turn-helix transcriptional regulator n=1 Tax=Kribbella sp. NPDC003505 TaxID=3154448 RepID=UPI0033A66A92